MEEYEYKMKNELEKEEVSNQNKDEELNSSFWRELNYGFIGKKLLYNPWGATTLNIPNFHIENICKIAKSASIEDHQYYDWSIGHRKLIKSIVKNFSQLYHKTINEKEILITPGALKASEIILFTFLNCDSKNSDELVLFEPYYPYYFSPNNFFHKFNKFMTIPFIHNKEQNMLVIDFELLEKSLNKNSKLLLLINPNNPTCNLFSVQDYEKITQIISKYPDLIVAEDCAYFPYTFGSSKITYFSSIADNEKRTVTFFSGGKVFNVTGLRVGWIVANENLISKISKTNVQLLGLSPSFEQLVIAKDLKNSFDPYENCINYWKFLSIDIEYRFKLFSDLINKNDFNVNILHSNSTYYLLMDISYYRNKIPDKFYKSLDEADDKIIAELDLAFCRMFLSEGIGFMPLSPTQRNKNKIDYIVRVSINRTEEDFNLVIAAFRSLKHKYNI